MADAPQLVEIARCPSSLWVAADRAGEIRELLSCVAAPPEEV